jgi:sodium/bile acid cotransporter 7
MSPKEKELPTHETSMTDVEDGATVPPQEVAAVAGRAEKRRESDGIHPAENESDAADDEEEEPPKKSCCRRAWDKWWKFYAQYEFLILVIVAICLAKAYPPLGAEYLQPQITSTWIAVIFIFSE